MEVELNLNKRYRLPENLKVILHKNKYIVIAPELSNWIVLDTQAQLDFFNLLRANTIQESIERFFGDEKDISFVLTQIEARHLESSNVLRKEYTQMQIYLTNKCNLRCPHCYMSAGIEYDDELSTSEVKNLLLNYRNSKGDRIILTGGEIGERNDLKDIIDYAYELGLDIELLTNGTKFSDSFVKSISPKIKRIQISIDGFSEESNSKVRGKGNFLKAMNCVHQFIENGHKVEVAVTPYPSSTLSKDVPGYVNFAKDLHKKYGNKIIIKFTTGILDGRNINTKKIDLAEYEDIMNSIIKEVYGCSDSFNGFVLAARNQAINDNCSYGSLNISSTGDVYPCAKITSTQPIANIRKDSWSEIIKGCAALRSSSNIDNLEPCNQCELKYICGGGCRVDFFEGFNNPKTLMHISTKRKDCENERVRILDLLISTNEFIYH